MLRETTQEKVDMLAQEIKRNPLGDYTELVCNIPDVQKNEIDKAKFSKGEYPIITLGGNAVLKAKLKLLKDEVNRKDPILQCLFKCTVKLYAGLEPIEAMKVALGHNRIHEFVEKISFMQMAKFIRRRKYLSFGTPEDQETPQDQEPDSGKQNYKPQWKVDLSSMLGLPNVSTYYKILIIILETIYKLILFLRGTV